MLYLHAASGTAICACERMRLAQIWHKSADPNPSYPQPRLSLGPVT